MVNLLPQNNLSALKKEYLNRLVTVVAVLLALVVVVVLIISATIYVTLSLKEKSLINEIGGSSLEAKNNNFEQVANSIADINANILMINTIDKKTSFQSVLDLVLGSKMAGISIQSLNFDNTGGENQRLSIKGQFNNRKVFIDYVDGLRKDPRVSAVNSPVDNLIKEVAGSFSLDLKLKTNQI